LCRSLLRDLLRGKTPTDPTLALAEKAGDSTLPRNTSDSRLNLSRHPDAEKDREIIRSAAKRLFEAMKDCEELSLAQRKPYVLNRLDEIEREFNPVAA
jgi:hypothetical protein